MLHVWNIYQHVHSKSPSHVGKYTIHGAYGYIGFLLSASGTPRLFCFMAVALSYMKRSITKALGRAGQMVKLLGCLMYV